MANRYKTTGCARFFIFLLFFIPIVYFGLKYFDDQGQLDEWRDTLNLDKAKNSVEEALNRKSSDDESEFDVNQVKRQLADLLSKIEQQEQIITDQETTIEAQKAKIERLTGTIQEETAPTTQAETPKKDGDLSLEELLKEADNALKKN